MTRLSSFSIIIVFLVLSLLGCIAIWQLPIQLLPVDKSSEIKITTNLYKSSSKVVEQFISLPIEKAISKLNGVVKISSVSANGSSIVTVKIREDIDKDLFRLEVSSSIRSVYLTLPLNTSYPRITFAGSQANIRSALISISFFSEQGNNKQMYDLFDSNIRPALSTIKGIEKIEILGVNPERLVITPYPENLRHSGLSYASLLRQLQGVKESSQSANLTLELQQRQVQYSSSLNDKKTIENFSVNLANGKFIPLHKLANVQFEPAPNNGIFRINGKHVLTVNFYPEKGVNTIKLNKSIKKTIELCISPLVGINAKINYEGAKIISAELQKVYIRTACSVFILLIFVYLINRQIKYLLLVITSITVNILISLLIIYLADIEIHLYSIAGITIALGLVIDNVIVIIEDIHQTSALRIFNAIVSSTLTTIGALLVVFLLPGTQKDTLIDFTATVFVVLFVSLPVGYFFIPALLNQFPLIKKSNAANYLLKQWIIRFNRAYRTQILFLLNRKAYMFSLCLLGFGIPIYLLPDQINLDSPFSSFYNSTLGSDYYNINIRNKVNAILGGSSYLFFSKDALDRKEPDNTVENKLTINVNMPVGATLDQMNQVCQAVENDLEKYSNQLEFFITRIDNPSSGSITVTFKEKHRGSIPSSLKTHLEDYVTNLGSAQFTVIGTGNAFSNSEQNEEFSFLTIRGYNYQTLEKFALNIVDSLKINPRIHDIIISPERVRSTQTNEEFIMPLENKMYLSSIGLKKTGIIDFVRQSSDYDSYVSEIKSGELIYLKNSEGKDFDLWNFNNAPIMTTDSSFNKLNQLTKVKVIRRTDKIKRENKEYLLNVNYQFDGSRESNQYFQSELLKRIANQLPYGYKVDKQFGTNFYQNNQSLYFILILVVISIIYLVSAALLESLYQALAVIIIIPFSFIGTFLSFYIFNVNQDIGVYATLLMVSGLVAGSSLYILNDFNFLLSKGYPKLPAYVKAFDFKFGPIFVTTISSILSLIPFMLFDREEGFWFILSIGTIGGLIFSLLGCYLLTPLILLNYRKIQPASI